MVGRGSIHPLGAGLDPAEDIAAADHYADLHAQPMNVPDFVRDETNDLCAEPVFLLPRQGLTANLQEDTPIL
jgi:hypothetical protein